MIEYVILEGPTTTLECAYEPGMQTQASATRRGARRSAMGRVEEQGKRKDAGIVVWIQPGVIVGARSRFAAPPRHRERRRGFAALGWGWGSDYTGSNDRKSFVPEASLPRFEFDDPIPPSRSRGGSPSIRVARRRERRRENGSVRSAGCSATRGEAAARRLPPRRTRRGVRRRPRSARSRHDRIQSIPWPRRGSAVWPSPSIPSPPSQML
jgi:hypothetical protein